MIEFTADIYCKIPGENLSYRLYVDDDLITERDWGWDEKRFFVREHVLLDLESGTHKVYVRIPGSMSINRFEIGNIAIDGDSVLHQNGVFEYIK